MRRCHRRQTWWIGLLALSLLLFGCDGYVPDDGKGMGGGPLPGSVDDLRRCEGTALCTTKCEPDDLPCVERCSTSLSQHQLPRLAPLVLCATRHQCNDTICLRDQCPSSLTACAVGAADPHSPGKPPRDRSCDEDDDCGEIGFCEEGRCVGLSPPLPKSKPCQSDRECGSHRRCHNRRCVIPPSGNKDDHQDDHHCDHSPRCSP